MSPMSDQPLTLAVLADFHREIILPDIQRIVSEAIAGSERRMQANFDAIFHKLDKLETEYESLKAGLERVEGRMESLEAQYRDLLDSVIRLDARLTRVETQLDAVVATQEKDPIRAEVAALRVRVEVLQLQMRNLEKRFDT